MCTEFVERALRNAFLSYAAFPGASVDERPDFLAVRSGHPLMFFNGVPFATLGDDADARVKETMAWFRERGVPFRWWILPSTRPSNLIEILKANGFRHTYDAPGMAIEIDALPQPKQIDGFTIKRVEGDEMLLEWANIFAVGFRRPEAEKLAWRDAYRVLGTDKQWRQFIGYLDGEPVASSSVCLGDDLAGVYHVVTLPPARGRGIGAAITLEALLEAKREGCRDASLQSSEMAFSVYKSLGFKHCCDLTLYDWRPE